MSKKALVIGATGLIGRNLVFELLKSPHYHLVTVFSRKDLVIKHEKLNQILLDFEDLRQYEDQMVADDVFCCLGSTKAKTPDLELYHRIDFDYPLWVANITKAKGATQFLLVSSLGADSNSHIFYSRLKGEIEDAILQVNFECYHVFRPSLLLGSRNENRPLETVTQYLMRVLNPLFIGPLKLYKAIKGSDVAKAMIATAIAGDKGHHLIMNNTIHQLAKKAN